MTARQGRLAVALLAGALLRPGAHAARAQLLPSAAGEVPRQSGGLAVEPELVATASYLHALAPPSTGDDRVGLGAGVKLTPLVASGDLRVNLLAVWIHRPSPRWGATCAGLPFMAHGESDAGSVYALGLELRCEPSLFQGRWSWGLDLGAQSAIATHISHSALARRTFSDRYPPGVEGIAGPRDGWYRFTAQRFRAGLSASRRFGSHWSGAIAAGTMFVEQHQGVYLALFPFYLELSIGHGG